MDDQKKILIVDDVEANRFVLRNIISEMGHLRGQTIYTAWFKNS